MPTLDAQFLESSQDAERCLTYVLLDKALLCCVVVLERSAMERELRELRSKYETTTEALGILRNKNDSLKYDNERLVGQLAGRWGETNVSPTIMSETSRSPVETLMLRNSKLQLEVKTLQKQLDARRASGAGTGKDLELGYLRERVSKLTKENEKLEFMMKVLGERMGEHEEGKRPVREAQKQVCRFIRYESSLINLVYLQKQTEFQQIFQLV